MGLQVSTKFKEMILGSSSFADIFDQGVLVVYSGAQPASANAAATGTELLRITNDGSPWTTGGSDGGLIFEQFGPWISKSDSQTWKGTVVANGTPGWFRLFGRLPDDNLLTYSAPRLDGSVGTTNASNLLIADSSLTIGQVIEINQFLYSIPPL